MHIMEGFLPHPWWEIWFALSLPIAAYGAYRIRRLTKDQREALPLLAVAGAFIFVISSLKLPSVTGSCSHPTGTAIGAILFGPWITAVLSTIVLIYQAIFLAHGGLTTLGANVFSMGIVGPAVAYLIYKGGMRYGLNAYFTVFLAGALSDWATYAVTSIQLALAYPASAGGVLTSFQAFIAIFAVTQIPLAIVEGAVTALMFKYIFQVKPDILIRLKVISERESKRLREASA